MPGQVGKGRADAGIFVRYRWQPCIVWPTQAIIMPVSSGPEFLGVDDSAQQKTLGLSAIYVDPTVLDSVRS
ncbi:hypothetical protein NDU88_005130 [Pleurodeles waltl]|uniref:Uncharacterized protein n=1 Tax=Pleurodeles waltl TaxID=8319 RepID=A0AAV7L6L5_PLEWA|nr:hypothetical protein NDU88_005130 [Pleurodeles waltl]